jgi:hypothetical protein
MNNKPNHQHDCSACIYLGSIRDRENAAAGYQDRFIDLYLCPKGTKTVIGRYGIDGEYTSGLGFADSSPVLAVAAMRAQILGHLTLDDIIKHTGPGRDYRPNHRLTTT